MSSLKLLSPKEVPERDVPQVPVSEEVPVEDAPQPVPAPEEALEGLALPVSLSAWSGSCF